MSQAILTRPARSNGKASAPKSVSTETQAFDEVRPNRLALPVASTAPEIYELNLILSDTLTLRDMYKKHHWQAAGPTFYMIHLLFDKHFDEQSKLVDEIAERIQTLGGIAIAMAADVAETTRIPRPPMGRENTATQIDRLIQAHEVILKATRTAAKAADKRGDDATNDLLVSKVLPLGELQVWFLNQHLQ